MKECAARAGVCESVVRGWVKSGLLPHYRLGLKRGKIAVAPADLDALVATFRVEGKGPEPVKAPAPPRPTFKHLRFR
ncbi:MAG TPA: helix-turn-helix domain-containing protein [Urbifossiella sp.]|nr:helix-turn-helix domain-containing protein [Urbifossiella sp.]